MRIDKMLGHRDRLLAALSLANGAAGLGAFAIVTTRLTQKFGDIGYGWSFALWLPVYLFAFELVPKALFNRFPYRALEAFTPVLQFIDWTLGAVLGMATPLLRLVKRTGESSNGDDDSLREDFRHLADAAGRYGAISTEEGELIHSALDFQSATIGEVMSPLDRTRTVSVDPTAEEWLPLATGEEIEHIPVLSNSGSVVGRLDTLALLLVGDLDPHAPASEAMRSVPAIRADQPAAEALAYLRTIHEPIGWVRAESAEGTAGVVAVGDILDALFVQFEVPTEKG